MRDLDNLETYTSTDPSNMGRRLQDLPRHCTSAWHQTQHFPRPVHSTPIDKIVIGGMGGSAIAGDLVADLASIHRPIPVVIVVRDLHLPFAPDQRSLVIVCSHSGNTEESLSLFHQAVQAGAAVLAVAGGGRLMEEARAQRIPLLSIDIAGEPRNAVAYNLMLLLGVLNSLGVVETTEEAVQATVQALHRQVSRLGPDVPAITNPAKQLARELVDKLVVVYGGGIFSGVARRWKTQLNENAKTWAFFEALPELLHNSVESFGAPPSMGESIMTVVLRPNPGEAWLQRRYSVLADLLHNNGIHHVMVDGADGPPLAQLMDMLLLGDYVSYYLALLRGIDPSPTSTIVKAKELLASPMVHRGK